MDLLLQPQKLNGVVTPPPSKSQAHRLIFAAALADGVSRISNVAFSQDIEATTRCMEALGASVRRAGTSLEVTGMFTGGRRPVFSGLPRLDCGESGSTLRFLIPVALAVAGGGVFTGRGRLMERPQKPYFALFDEKHIACSQKDGVLTVEGTLQSGLYRLPGNVSSQFFTGLFYALPLLKGTSRIESTTPLESAGYLAMTLEALNAAGVSVSPSCGTDGAWNAFSVPGGCVYTPFAQAVEADWSQAAFFYTALGLENPVEIAGMNRDSAQGDRVIAAYHQQLCGDGEVTLDVSQCPDLVPALALHGALRDGAVTRIVGAARLRIKESDRLATVTETLDRLGAQVEEGPDSLTICGVNRLHGGEVDSHNDHRIAMMAAIAATCADGPVLLRDAGSVAKSYPDFWQVYASLGGRFEEVTP